MAIRLKLSGAPVIPNWQEAEKVMARLAELTRQRRQRESEAQAEIDKIKAKLNEDTKEIQVEQAQLEKNMEDFVTYHKSEFDDGKTRSRDLTTGVVGFRRSTGKLVTVKGWTWDKVLAKLTEMKRKNWIETKTAVKKETILAERRNNAITDDELAVYGISFQQPDEFWYEVRDAEAVSAAIYDLNAAGGGK
jgi:phage host-nuclease inhibitor protein Gam